MLRAPLRAVPVRVFPGLDDMNWGKITCLCVYVFHRGKKTKGIRRSSCSNPCGVIFLKPENLCFHGVESRETRSIRSIVKKKKPPNNITACVILCCFTLFNNHKLIAIFCSPQFFFSFLSLNQLLCSRSECVGQKNCRRRKKKKKIKNLGWAKKRTNACSKRLSCDFKP